jgi:hypothetical protein
MTDERVKTTQRRWAKLAVRLRHLGGIGAAQRCGARLVGAPGGGHEVHANPSAASGRRVRLLFLAAILMAALGTFATPRAYAGGLESFCSSTLLEKDHFCHSESLGSEAYMFLISGENLTNSNPVCVGPVEWNGKEYTYPYGWSCGTGLHSWEFTPIGGVAAAVENPNSPPEKIGGGYIWSYLPAGTTGSATGIASEKATLDGTVSSKGSETDYWFEYGKTTSYGSSTKKEEAGFSESKPVSANISSLEAGTIYHYRLVAKNRVGTTYGSDGMFTTLGRAVTAGSHESGEQDVFWEGTSAALFEGFYAESKWHGPYNWGMGPLGSAPSVAVRPNGEEDVFWEGTNKALFEAYEASGSWHGPYEIGMGPLGSPPTATAWGEQVDVFWEGTNGGLFEGFYAEGKWHGPYEVAGMGPLNSLPTAGSHTSGEQDVFWEGTDGGLFEGFYAEGKWHGPYNWGMGPLGSAPSVAVRPNGEEDVFWEGTNKALFEAYEASGSWHGPYEIGMGPLGSPPSATAWGEQVDVFWAGTNGILFEAYEASGSWHGPYEVAGMGPIE